MPSKRDFLRIGVTGGIGAGKSEVCAAFARKGRVVLAADAIARLLMENDPSVRKRVAAICGSGAYHPDGTVNVPHVAREIFGDEKKRTRLDAVVHPAVLRRITKEIAALADDRRRPYVIIEAALLYESGMEKDLDAVLVVHASDTVRIDRVLARGGMTRDEVVSRMEAQMPADEKRANADFVMLNDGPLASIADRVAFFDALFTAMAG
ncbi:dephospho-CoA kinase [uncultured bacterium]|nr:dephospho-CoA kinase [uncultured bacterium]